MDIFIDDLIFSLQQAGGISVYWSELMKRMNAVANEHVITCISTQGHQNILAGKINWQHPTIADNRLPIQAKRFLPLLKKLPAKSIFHSSYLRWCWQKDVVNILTIHDLAPEKGLINGKAKYIRQLQQRIALQHADGVLCVSETIRKDLLNHYAFLQPEKVKAVYHGVSDAFYSTGQKEGIQPFVLFVGHRSGYKNFGLAVEVVSAIPNMQMMVVGGKQLTAHERYLLNEKLPNRFVFKATVDIQELNNLYNHAFCLLYPSAYEGFGLPIAEAMKVGCPVVTTNKVAIPEVAGNGALLVNELVVDAFVEAIQSLQHQSVRNYLFEHGQKQAMNFSWDDCYNQTTAFYQTIWQSKFR